MSGADTPRPAQWSVLEGERELLTRLGGVLPEGVKVGLRVVGPEGGEWSIQPEGVQPFGSGPKDCTIRCSNDVLHSILRGNLDARTAFLQGLLEIEGDVGLAMRMQQALPRVG